MTRQQVASALRSDNRLKLGFVAFRYGYVLFEAYMAQRPIYFKNGDGPYLVVRHWYQNDQVGILYREASVDL
jgi:hypothetical protein